MGSGFYCCIKYLHNTHLCVYMCLYVFICVYMCLFLYVAKIKYFINIYISYYFIHDSTTFES